MQETRKLLIIGGAGQLGEFVIRELRGSKDAYDITVFDMRPPRIDGVNFVKGDIRSLDSLTDATTGMDFVIHLAAIAKEKLIPDYRTGWDVNSTSNFNVFEAAVVKKVKTVVFASSICATGPITWTSSDHAIEYFPIDEAHPCRPQDLYGVTKAIGEQLAAMYSKRSDTAFISLRMATVWFKSDTGPDESTRTILDSFVRDPSALDTIERSADERRAMYVIKDPKAAIKDLTWQYVDARDAAQAFRLALEKDARGHEAYNIGGPDSPSPWSSLKLAQHFYPEVPITDPPAFLVAENKPLWDITKARRELGYRPRHGWKEYQA